MPIFFFACTNVKYKNNVRSAWMRVGKYPSIDLQNPMDPFQGDVIAEAYPNNWHIKDRAHPVSPSQPHAENLMWSSNISISDEEHYPVWSLTTYHNFGERRPGVSKPSLSCLGVCGGVQEIRGTEEPKDVPIKLRADNNKYEKLLGKGEVQVASLLEGHTLTCTLRGQ